MYFNADLKLGKKIENIVCDYIIQPKYPLAYVVEGYCKGYDIVVPDDDLIEKKIEVKYDAMSTLTDNYMFETEYGGEASGLTTTTADWWLHVDNDVSIWICPKALREILKDYRIIKMKGVGDSKEKCGYLIPKIKLLHSPYTFVVPHSSIVKNLISNL